jgi:hypothetical protein
MFRFTQLFASLTTLTALTLLTGCGLLQSYKEPTEGARARVRLIGNQPGMATYQCGDDDANPRGFAYYGGKRHDLHMPNPPKETSDLTEYYVVANKHLTISFAGMSVIPPKGYQVHYSGPFCNHTAVTFIPEPGHDYEVRENGDNFCSASVRELVPGTSGTVQYVPVTATSCPKQE